MALTEPVRAHIESLVTANPVVLFMKGNRQFPQCGFSAKVVQILDEVVGSYETVNVLSDPGLRDGIKEYSSWPTIPQLYVRGQFVGGCDIITEMHASGELGKLVGAGEVAIDPPRIEISARAAEEIGKAAADADRGEKLRVVVNPSFEPELFFDAPKEGDFVVEVGRLQVLVDRSSARRANGLRVDFTSTPQGAGFRIDNPNEPPRVRPLKAAELKGRIDAGERIHLFDVRPEVERKVAKIEGAVPLDAEGVATLEALPKDAPIVFQCHHGIRSQAAAQEALRRGFTRVHNLEGGIDAWSQDVDPKVPRY
jgi:monothiol glutaredoxin